jgi:hypothetical protein
MPYTLIGTASGHNNIGGQDTRNATLILYAAGANMSPNEFLDLHNNSWQNVRREDGSGSVSLVFCRNPITSISHTFHTFLGTNIGICVAWYSGGTSDVVLNLTSGNHAGSLPQTSIAPGALIPTVADQMRVSALGLNNDANTLPGDILIDTGTSGFTIIAAIGADGSGGTRRQGCALAHQISPPLTSSNPVWSWTGSQPAAAVQAVLDVVNIGELKSYNDAVIFSQNKLKSWNGLNIGTKLKTWNGFRPIV